MNIEEERKIIDEIVLKVYGYVKKYHEDKYGPFCDLEDQEMNNGFNWSAIESYFTPSVIGMLLTKDGIDLFKIGAPLVKEVRFTKGYKNKENHECHIVLINGIDDLCYVSGLTILKRFEDPCLTHEIIEKIHKKSEKPAGPTHSKCDEADYCATWVFGGNKNRNIILSGGMNRNISIVEDMKSNEKYPTELKCSIGVNIMGHPKAFIDPVEKNKIFSSNDFSRFSKKRLEGSLEFAELLARAVDHTFKDYPDLYEL
jgi:hypothetical protein